MQIDTREIYEEKLLDFLVTTIGMSKRDILRESLTAFLEKKLKEIKLQIYEISKKYGISTIEEFEELYKKGIIEEKFSWKDYQRLDHLEFKKEQLEKILKKLDDHKY